MPPQTGPVEADDDSFITAIDGALPVLVEFWAPWCGPCQTVAPAVEQVVTESAGQLKVVTVNVDNAPAVTQRFAIHAVPTLVLLNQGREVARRIGVLPATAVARWLGCLPQAAA
jgi:thioredoxin 2